MRLFALPLSGTVSRHPAWIPALLPLVLGSVACPGKPVPPPAEPSPAVAKVEILPKPVAAAPDRMFQLTVRLRDVHGHPLPQSRAASVVWSSSNPSLQMSGSTGYSILVGGSAGTEATLTAAIDGLSGTADVRVAEPVPAEVTDWIAAPHTDGWPPAIALVDGDISDSERRSDSLIAFAGAAPIAAFRNLGNEGEVVLFSTGVQPVRVSRRWSDGCEMMTFGPGALQATACEQVTNSLLPPAPVPLRVWILASGSNILSEVKSEIDQADAFFRKSRAGTALERDGEFRIRFPATAILDVAAPDYKCPEEFFARLADLGADQADFNPRGVNLIVVNAIEKTADAGGTVPSEFLGYTCPWDAAKGSVILVSWSGRSGTTVTHEFGHALGGWITAPWGHVDFVPGFDESNIMWSYHSGYVPVGRAFLTLGQAYKLSIDSYAFINRTQTGGPNQGVICQTTDTDKPCPRLSKDPAR